MEGGAAFNPYAPPTGDIEYNAPSRPEAFPRALYSPRQMLAGALVGSLFVGVLMLWLNYRAMAQTRPARLTLVLGFPAAIVWMALGFLPVRAGDFNFVVGLMFYGFCNPIQGPAIYRHYGAGGKRSSNWMVAAFVLMSTVLTFVAQAVLDARRLDF